jgi:transcription initiation factor TFIIB
MTELERLADKLHIPKSVKDEAALIYRKALDVGLVRGRSISAIVAASLYAACRFTETPRKLNEIVKASSKRRRDITRCYRQIVTKLDLKMPIDTPLKFIQKIALKVGLNQKTQNKAIQILRKARKEQVTSGKGPIGLAAAALYIAHRPQEGNITQCELANAAGITEVTVRNRYKGLIRSLDLNV